MPLKPPHSPGQRAGWVFSASMIGVTVVVIVTLVAAKVFDWSPGAAAAVVVGLVCVWVAVLLWVIFRVNPGRHPN